MSAAGWPDAVLFEPSEASRSELRAMLPGPGVGGPLLLVVEPDSPADWWRSAALAVADALTTADRPVLLLDLHVPSTLATMLDIEPGDGLTDVLDFGASLDHAIRRPAGRSFEFLPPGSAATDAARLAGAPGWRRLLDRQAAGRQVVVVAPEGALRDADWAAGAQTVALAGPASAGAGDAAVRLVPPGPAPARPPAKRPTDSSRAGEGRRIARRNPIGWTLLVVLLVSLLAGAWHYFVRGWLVDRRAPDAEAPSPAQPVAADTTAPVALAWSVAIEAHGDLPTAHERVASLEAADPDAPYFISPVLVDSVLYYRVMAGPVRDSASAALVAQRLIAMGQRVAASARDVRRAPLSFLIAEYATRDEAEQRRAELRILDIPSFVLESPARPEARFRVYTGAYSGLAEADVMAQMLRSAGLPDSLVTLTGGSP